MGSCRLLERDSKLYSKILAYTGNREIANYIYAATLIPEFLESLSNIEFENGEPTFESLVTAIDFKELTDSISLNGVKLQLGIQDYEGNDIELDTADEAVSTSININEENPEYVATPERKKDKYTIQLEEKTDLNKSKPKLLVFNSTLNNKLLGILRSIGFDAVEDAGIRHGIFDPQNAERTLNGFITAIRVAKGIEGEQAFPEEFSHLMIEGLSTTPLVSRFLNSISNDMIEPILGLDYEEYYNRYNGNRELLRKEAAGKLLLASITGQPIEYQYKNKSLLSRIWQFIKNLLNKANENSIQEAIQEAEQLSETVANYILNEDLISVIDKDAILKADTLYKVAGSVRKEIELAELAVNIMSRRIRLQSLKSKERVYNKDDVHNVKLMLEYLEDKKYAKSSLLFLQDTLSKVENINNQLEKLSKSKVKDTSNLLRLKRISIALKDIKDLAEGYLPIVTLLEEISYYTLIGNTKLTQETADNISNLAREVGNLIRHISSQYNNLRFQTVYNFLKIYWGEDKIIDVGKNKGTRVTLESILRMADKDINGIDRWISSLSAASDPLLTVIDKAVKMSQYERDRVLNNLLPQIRAVHKIFINLGGKTSFMYERDEEGNLTGNLISDRDFVAFRRDRREFIDSLRQLKKEGKLKSYQIKARIEKWDKEHTDTIMVDEYSERTEKVPKKSLYPSDALEKLTEAERLYYDQMMKFKNKLDNLLPARYVKTYRAVLIRNDMTEALADNINNPKQMASMALGNIKDRFVRRNDDTEFGELFSRGEVLDFKGNPINKLPVYYTQNLEDMSRLSTDFTSSIIAYAGMAVNYNEMNKIVDILEITQDLVNDREVALMSGDNHIIESMKVLGREMQKSYTKKGSESNIGARLLDYMDQVVWQKSKKDEGTIDLFGKKADKAKSVDAIRGMTGATGLGFNLFSGISNITMGKLQIFIEAMSGLYFGYKNAAIGKKNYYSLLPAYLAELNSTSKTNKLALLIDEFDALLEFYARLKNDNFYLNLISRALGNTSIFILNNMGEHYLHSRTMLAMLDRLKVKDANGKEMSLFEAYEVEDITDDNGNVVSAKLKLKDGITKLDGSAFTKEDFFEIKRKIQRVNQSLNGAFNSEDRGAIHRYCLGRLAMQFRLWMPEHYNRRFAGTYYDAMMDEYREGYYRTVGRFVGNLAKDLIKGKFLIATHWNSLSNSEKSNFRRAAAEVAAFSSLILTCSCMGKAKDYRGIWAKRMLYYLLLRLKLETGASVPSLDFTDNVFTILKSPAAAINYIDSALNLLKIQNMFVEKTSGRYKGWSEWSIDASRVIPIYGLGAKIIDLDDEDYMFRLFNEQ